MAQAALTAGEQTALAGRSTVQGWLSYKANRALVTAEVDASSPLTEPYLDLPVKNAGANWTTLVKRGLTVKFVTGNAYPQTRYYRVRKDASSTTVLPLMEASWGDTGLMAYETTNNLYLDNSAQITVTDRRDLWTQIPRISGSTVYDDYDNDASVTAENLIPYPVGNLGAHRSYYIGSASSTSLSWTMTPNYFPTGAGANSPHGSTPYAWTVDGTWTVTAGGGTGTNATMTATVPAGEYWVQCDLLDLRGVHYPSYRYVWVHNTSNPPLPVTRATITKDFTGTRARLLLPDYTVANLSEGQMVNYFEQATWNGSSTSVPSASTNVTGWITRIDFTIERGVRYAEIEIGGPAEFLNRLGGFTHYLSKYVSSGTPLATTELYEAICTIDYILWVMIVKRMWNLATLFDHHPYSTSPTAYDFPYAKFGNGSLLRQLQELADGALKCNYGFDSTGAGWVLRHPSLTMAYSAARDTTRRDTLSPSKYIKPTGYSRNMRPSTRKVRGSFYFYNAGTLTPYVVLAPGKTPGQGLGEATVQDVVVSSLDEAKELTGHLYARENAPYSDVTFEIAGNRDVYEPAQMPMVDYSWTSAQTPENFAKSGTGTVSRVSKTVETGGAANMQVTVEPLTQGAPGVQVY